MEISYLKWGRVAILSGIVVAGTFILYDTSRRDIKPVDFVEIVQGHVERFYAFTGVSTNPHAILTVTNYTKELSMVNDPNYPGYLTNPYREDLPVPEITITEIASPVEGSVVIPKFRVCFYTNTTPHYTPQPFIGTGYKEEYGPSTEVQSPGSFFLTNVVSFTVDNLPDGCGYYVDWFGVDGSLVTVKGKSSEVYIVGSVRTSIRDGKIISFDSGAPNFVQGLSLVSEVTSSWNFVSHPGYYEKLFESLITENGSNVYAGTFDVWKTIYLRGALKQEQMTEEEYTYYTNNLVGSFTDVYGHTQDYYTFSEKQIISNSETDSGIIIDVPEGEINIWTNYFTSTNSIPTNHADYIETKFVAFTTDERSAWVRSEWTAVDLLTYDIPRIAESYVYPKIWIEPQSLVPHYYQITNFDASFGTNVLVKQTVTNLFKELAIGDRTNKWTSRPGRTYTNVGYVVSYTNYGEASVCYTSEVPDLTFFVTTNEAGDGFDFLTATNPTSYVVVQEPLYYDPSEFFTRDIGDITLDWFTERFKVLNALHVTDFPDINQPWHNLYRYHYRAAWVTSTNGYYKQAVIDFINTGSTSGLPSELDTDEGSGFGFQVSRKANLGYYDSGGKRYYYTAFQQWAVTNINLSVAAFSGQLGLYAEPYQDSTGSNCYFNEMLGTSNMYHNFVDQAITSSTNSINIAADINGFGDASVDEFPRDPTDDDPGEDYISEHITRKSVRLRNNKLLFKPDFEYCLSEE